jgi:hypothetical protein
MARRTIVRLLVITVAVLLGPGTVRAQDLFRHTTDPHMVATLIQMALPAAQRGLALLQASATPRQIDVAVDSIWDAYRYLRSAQESSENIEAHARFKDPLVELRNARILEIRDRFRWCRERREHLVAQEPEITARCTQGLVEGIRSLQIVVATVN